MLIKIFTYVASHYSFSELSGPHQIWHRHRLVIDALHFCFRF